jgi:hypothetical protein
MARIVNRQFYQVTSGVVTDTFALPAHNQNDLLVIIIADNANSTHTESGATWNNPINNTSTGHTQSWWWKIAGASEADPTFNFSASSVYSAVCFVIEDAPHSSPIETSGTTTSGGAASTAVTPAITTSSADCLAIHAWSAESRFFHVLLPTNVRTEALISESLSNLDVASNYYPSSGVQQTISASRIRAVSRSYAVSTLVIKNDTNGRVQGQIPLTSAPSTILGSYSLGTTNIASLLTPLDGATTTRDGYDTGSGAQLYKQFECPQTQDGGDAKLNYAAGSLTGDATQLYTTSQDLSNSLVTVSCVGAGFEGWETYENGGLYFGFVNSTQAGATIWKVSASDTLVKQAYGAIPFVINTAITDGREVFGTNNLTSVDDFVWAATTKATSQAFVGPPHKLNTMVMTYGKEGSESSFIDCAEFSDTSTLRTVQAQVGQSQSQFFVTQSIQIGDGGTTVTRWKSSNQSMEMPRAYSEADKDVSIRLNAGDLSLTVYAGSSDSIDLSNTILNFGNYHTPIIHASSSTSATYSFDGCVWLNAGTPTIQTGISYSGLKVQSSQELVHNSASLSGVTIDSVASGETAALQFSASNQTELTAIGTQCGTLTVSNNTNAPAIRINYTGAAGAVTIDLSDVTFSGNETGGDLHFESTNNCDLSIIRNSGTLTTTASAGSTVTVVAPITALRIDPDITITVNGAIRYFDGTPDDQTPNDSGTGDLLDYVYSTTDPIDIEVVEQFYVPVNQQNVTPSNSTRDITMDFDEAYNASHGLALATDYTYTRTDAVTGTLALLTDQSALDIRSALADEIRTNASYYNTKLLLEAIPGLVRIDQLGGLTVTGMDHWKRAGSEVFDAADSSNPVAKWFAIQSVGNITGATAMIRQVSSGDATAVSLTNNVIDEAFQYFKDDNHDALTTGPGEYDRSTYALIKSFKSTFRQGRIDILANAGISALQSTLYVVPLSNAAHTYSGLDPGISADLSLVKHSPALTVDGKSFTWEIRVANNRSATDIANQLHYNAVNNPNATISGYRYFDLPDMCIFNGSNVETEYGVFDDTGTPYSAGVIVRNTADDSVHLGFARQESDTEGVYYEPATSVSIVAPNLIDGTLVVVADLDNPGTWLDDGTVVSGGAGYTLTLPFTGNKNIQLRAGHTDKRIVKENLLLTSGGATYLGTPAADEFYAHHAIDGSLVTGYALDYIFNEIDVVVPDVFNALQGYAWYKYKMMTDATALKRFAGLLDYLSLGHLRFDDVTVDAVVGTALDVKFDNITSPPKEIVESSGIRVDRASGTRPVRTPTTSDAGIDVDWRSDVYVALVTTSDQSLNLATAEQALANKGVTSTRMAEMDNIPTILADTADMQPKVVETHQRLGLDAANPVTNKQDGGYSFGDVSVTGTTDANGNVIQQRQ